MPGVSVTGQEAFQALLAKPTCVIGAGVALQERKSDRAVDVLEDVCGSGPEGIELGAQLVCQRDLGRDEVFAGTHECLQRDRLVAAGRESGEAVTVGAGELAEHHRVEAVALAWGGTVAVPGGLDLVGVDRQHADAGGQEPADQEPVGTLDRAALDSMRRAAA